MENKIYKPIATNNAMYVIYLLIKKQYINKVTC
jgi:hypothetical protein